MFLSFYIKLVRDENKLDNVKAQLLIEESWIDIVTELHSDDAFLEKKYSHRLQSKLIKARKTLELLKDRIRIKFPNISPFLNDITVLMITFAYAQDAAIKEIGYTHTCGIIGSKI